MERIEKLKDFLRMDPSDSFLQHALALEYIKAGEDDQARQLFEELISRRPDYIGSYYHLAKLLERSGDIPGAASWFRKGIEEAKKAGDYHSLNELQAAYEELVM